MLFSTAAGVSLTAGGGAARGAAGSPLRRARGALRARPAKSSV